MPTVPRARIVAIGDEILIGRIVDTNSAWLADTCGRWGIKVTGMQVVGDEQSAIETALSQAAEVAELVLVTGGLGPTEDDRTRYALAALLGAPLRPHGGAWRQIERYYRHIRHDERVPESNRRQALIPRGVRVLRNDRGTAPGLLARCGGAWITCMPGVPHEMKAMAERLGGELDGLVDGAVVPAVEEVHLAGLGESRAQDLLGDLLVGTGRLQVGITAHELGHLTVRLIGSRTGVARRRAAIRKAVRSWLLPAEGLAASLVARLSASGKTVTMAESCTAGQMTALLGAVPGASRVLRESVVTYCNQAKQERLGVAAELLARHGAVSEEVVCAMAEGARRCAGADLALAASGIAGPEGGTPAKPVGTVWIAAADRWRTVSERLALFGDRQRIQHRAAASALRLGWNLLAGRL